MNESVHPKQERIVLQPIPVSSYGLLGSGAPSSGMPRLTNDGTVDVVGVDGVVGGAVVGDNRTELGVG